MAGITRKVGGARRRRTVCWTRKSKKGKYVVCNKSRGQRTMRKKKKKSNKGKKSNKRKGKTRTLRMTWFN